jgi:DnaJ-class molecular chaperone
MTLAFFQNMSFWDLVFIASLIYLLYSRAGMRSSARAETRAPEQPKPAASSQMAECYTVLEVPASASDEQIRESYKNLVKVWHPDRFPNDAKLREKADHKLKQINAAYEKVMAARK